MKKDDLQTWMDNHLIIDMGDSKIKADDLKDAIRDKLTDVEAAQKMEKEGRELSK